MGIPAMKAAFIAILVSIAAFGLFAGVATATPEPEGGFTCTRAEDVVTSPCLPDFPFPWDGWPRVELGDDFITYLYCIWEASKLSSAPNFATQANGVTLQSNRPEILKSRAYTVCVLQFRPTVSMFGWLAFLDTELLKAYPGVPVGHYQVNWSRVANGVIETIRIGSERDRQLGGVY